MTDKLKDDELQALKKADALISFLFYGDIGKLTQQERVNYIVALCERLGLDPASKPFDLIETQAPGGGKRLIVYANKACAAQLQKRDKLNVEEIYAGPLPLGNDTFNNEVYMVRVKVVGQDNRFTYEVGVSSILNKRGDDLANAIMKAHTKAHRRAILKHCGLGFTDESETDTMAGVRVVSPAQRQIEEGVKLDLPLKAEAKIN